MHDAYKYDNLLTWITIREIWCAYLQVKKLEGELEKSAALVCFYRLIKCVTSVILSLIGAIWYCWNITWVWKASYKLSLFYFYY